MAEVNDNIKKAVIQLAESVWQRDSVPPPYPVIGIKIWLDPKTNEIMVRQIDEAEFYYGGPK